MVSHHFAPPGAAGAAAGVAGEGRRRGGGRGGLGSSRAMRQARGGSPRARRRGVWTRAFPFYQTVMRRRRTSRRPSAAPVPDAVLQISGASTRTMLAARQRCHRCGQRDPIPERETARPAPERGRAGEGLRKLDRGAARPPISHRSSCRRAPRTRRCRARPLVLLVGAAAGDGAHDLVEQKERPPDQAEGDAPTHQLPQNRRLPSRRRVHRLGGEQAVTAPQRGGDAVHAKDVEGVVDAELGPMRTASSEAMPPGRRGRWPRRGSRSRRPGVMATMPATAPEARPTPDILPWKSRSSIRPQARAARPERRRFWREA